jgi:chaperonin cofactor prefoldin
LSQKFEINRGQIRQIEGEYDFLFEKIQDSYAQDSAKVLKAIISDPKSGGVFPADLVSGVKEEIEAVEDDIELNRDDLVEQAKKMNRELKELHEEQVDNFKRMSTLTREYSIGGLRDDVYLKYQHEDALEESQESYEKMVNILEVQSSGIEALR